MKKNVGKVDSIIRILIAIVIAVLYFLNVITGTLAIVLLIVGLVLLITALTGFCGLYKLFGMQTCPMKKEEKSGTAG